MKNRKIKPSPELNWVYAIENQEGKWFTQDEKGFTDRFSKSLKFRGKDAMPMAKLYLWLFEYKLKLKECKVVSLPEIVFIKCKTSTPGQSRTDKK